jgi:polyphosphate kinase
MRHLLASVPYTNKDEEVVQGPDPLIVGHASEIYEEGEHTMVSKPNALK